MKAKQDRGNKLRFGLIGAGKISDSYCQAFRATCNATLVYIADTRPEAAAEMAGRYGCEAISPERLLDSDGIDAVIVATPPNTHTSLCLDLLERKIPVLCEKPISMDIKTATSISRKAREKRVLFTMASKFRYVDDVVRARKIVDSGILGDILLFENTFMSFVDMKSRWNSQSSVSGGGVLIDNGTHSVDIMRYFIGPLRSIHVVCGPQVQNLPVEETAHVTALSEEGAVGRMDLSWSITKQCDDYIAVYGSNGALRVGWKASAYRQNGNSNYVQFGKGYNKVQAFSSQVENFSAAVQGLEQLLIDDADAIASVEVIQAGYQAIQAGGWVQVPEVTAFPQTSIRVA